MGASWAETSSKVSESFWPDHEKLRAFKARGTVLWLTWDLWSPLAATQPDLQGIPPSSAFCLVTVRVCPVRDLQHWSLQLCL